MSAVVVQGLGKCYDKRVWALRGVDLAIAEGEFMALVGHSGCGKTTLLRLLAGFERPDTGAVSLMGQGVCGAGAFIAPERRRIGMVFQDYALFPHLTVADNVGFGLKGKDPERVSGLLDLVGLDGYQSRYPHELSGGQQQRVALARALAPRPRLLLLDEPFSNLDVAARDELRREIRRIVLAAGTTAVMVTHDIRDALHTVDRMAVLRQGRLLQVAAPRRLYERPCDLYVARLFGRLNLLPAVRQAVGYDTALGPVDAAHVDGDALLVIRPEHLRLVEVGAGDGIARVEGQVFEGGRCEVEVALQGGEGTERLCLYLDGTQVPSPGAEVGVAVDWQQVMVLAAEKTA